MIGEPDSDLIIKLTDIVRHPLHDLLAGKLISSSGRMRLPSAMGGRYFCYMSLNLLCVKNGENRFKNY